MAEVVKDLVPESGVEKVKHSVLCSSDVEIDHAYRTLLGV